jgi:regulatory protein
LVRRGVSGEVIDSTLETVTPDEERAAAEALVRKKLASTSRLERQARVRRLVGLLARRGYSPGLSMAVVLEALGGEDDGDPTPFGEEYI